MKSRTYGLVDEVVRRDVVFVNHVVLVVQFDPLTLRLAFCILLVSALRLFLLGLHLLVCLFLLLHFHLLQAVALSLLLLALPTDQLWVWLHVWKA